MSNPSRFHKHYLAKLIAGLGALTALLTAAALAGGPLGPAEAAAACKGSDKPAKRIGLKRATSATVCLINKRRRAKDVRSLSRRSKLARAARSHAKTMKRRRCYAHTCPGGPPLSGRLSRAGYLPCGCTYRAGETLNYGRRGEASPREIVREWLASSSHRATLFDPGFKHLGVGVKLGSPVKPRSRRSATYVAVFGSKR